MNIIMSIATALFGLVLCGLLAYVAKNQFRHREFLMGGIIIILIIAVIGITTVTSCALYHVMPTLL